MRDKLKIKVRVIAECNVWHIVTPLLWDSKTPQNIFVLEFEIENFPTLTSWGDVNATKIKEGERKVRN